MANPTIATEAATAAAPASDMAAPAAKMQEAEKTLNMLEDDAVPVTHSGTEAALASEHATPSALGFVLGFLPSGLKISNRFYALFSTRA